MKKPLAEFIGTFTLVLFGCGATVIAGGAILASLASALHSASRWLVWHMASAPFRAATLTQQLHLTL